MDQQPIPLRGRHTARPRARGADDTVESAPVEPEPVLTAPLPAQLVVRPRLLRLLDLAVQHPLTVVRAPAGTGKTVAVASWATGPEAPRPAVWVTVGSSDLTGPGVWSLVVEELHHQGLMTGSPVPGPGSLAYDRLFLFALAARLARLPRPVVLVLDAECRLPTSTGAALHYLVQHSAGRLRLVLLTREEPPLPMWRYRLSDSVAEIHLPELAFTEEEAGELLSAHGVSLTPDALADLTRRTGGWAVGLTLAARELAADPGLDAERIRGVTGPIADYLVSEILDTHPAAVRGVLLQTSAPELLRPGLVEMLAGRRGPRTVSALLSQNALLEETPGVPGGYRYVPMFRELLRSRMAAESPERAVALERSVADWMAANGLVRDAVTRAVATGSWSDAARYVVEDLGVADLLGHPADHRLADSLSGLPADVPGAPAALVRAAVAMAAGDLAAAGQHLEHAETLVDSHPFAAGRLALELVRMEQATRAGEVKEALTAAEAADEALRVQDDRLVAARPEIAVMIATARGSALATLGDLEEAARALAAGIEGLGRSRSEVLATDCLGEAALVAGWRGDLTRAVELAEAALAHQSGVPSRCPGPADVALAWVCADRYEFTGPRSRILTAPHPPVPPEGPLARAMLALARSRARRAAGDITKALTELADPTLQDLPGWLRERLRVEVAAAHLAAGNLGRAAVVVDHVATPEIAEAELVRAQIALANGEDQAAPMDALASGAQVTLASRVSSRLLQAASLLQRKDRRSAVSVLALSLRMAGAERMRRPFEEAPIEVRRLLRTQTGLRGKHPWLGDQPHLTARREPEPPLMVEPLTEREREVLALLADLLSTEEIAGALFVSVNTVRTHVRSILRKLGAARRNEAIRRARSLGILPAQPSHDGITRYG